MTEHSRTDDANGEQTEPIERLLADEGESSGARPSSPQLRSDGGEHEGMQDMSLDELREEIESIDRELVELIARRTYVADSVAAVKDEQDLSTTDEEQEQRVMDRAGKNAEQFDVDANLVKAIFRLLIELNKVEQRESR
ncbi:Chorismate mutase [Salinarchaeum sp. Harcht-Bsk1]|nr:Chorismate mutase [Salinarchaeum sp. Harcht-Bsk1]